MAEIRRGLSRFMPEHHGVRVDKAERVDHYFTFNTLYGIDDHGHGSVGQGLEALLCVYVDAREPAAEARVRVVPADDHFGSACLLEHVYHFRLKH